MERRLASALLSREVICGLVQVLLNKDTFFECIRIFPVIMIRLWL